MNEDKRCLDFEIEAAKEVYAYIVERSDHITGINAEVFATRCVVAGFGEYVAKMVKKGKVPRVDITGTVEAQIKRGSRAR